MTSHLLVSVELAIPLEPSFVTASMVRCSQVAASPRCQEKKFLERDPEPARGEESETREGAEREFWPKIIHKLAICPAAGWAHLKATKGNIFMEYIRPSETAAARPSICCAMRAEPSASYPKLVLPTAASDED